MTHTRKNFQPIVRLERGLPKLKSNALTTEPKSRLPDAVQREWIYTYKLLKEGVLGQHYPYKHISRW